MQIKADFPTKTLAKFPPKKLLTLTPEQLEERRRGLEAYMQSVCEDPEIIKTLTFRNFLIESQEVCVFDSEIVRSLHFGRSSCQNIVPQEMREHSVPVEFPIKLPDGSHFSLKALSLDRTERAIAVSPFFSVWRGFVLVFSSLLCLSRYQLHCPLL